VRRSSWECGGCARIDEASVSGRRKSHRWDSSLCETRCADADELHRKERNALRLDWRHLPSLPCLRSALRCDWKTGDTRNRKESDSDGYGRSKAADVTEGYGIDIYTSIISRDMS